MVDPVSTAQAAAAYGNAARITEDMPASGASGTVSDFSKLVTDVLQSGVGSVQKAEQLSTMAAQGGKVNLTELVTAISNAELALNTIVSIRDRAISAYDDIIKMPI